MSQVGEALSLIAEDLDATRQELRNRDQETLLMLRNIAASQTRIEKALLGLVEAQGNLEQDLETHKNYTAERFRLLSGKKSNGQLAPAE